MTHPCPYLSLDDVPQVHEQFGMNSPRATALTFPPNPPLALASFSSRHQFMVQMKDGGEGPWGRDRETEGISQKASGDGPF